MTDTLNVSTNTCAFCEQTHYSALVGNNTVFESCTLWTYCPNERCQTEYLRGSPHTDEPLWVFEWPEGYHPCANCADFSNGHTEGGLCVFSPTRYEPLTPQQARDDGLLFTLAGDFSDIAHTYLTDVTA